MKSKESPSRETLDAWHDDPANWKLGIFYFNKKDKRIFPPKRYYFGWTMNFANPYSILMTIVLVLAILLLAKYFRGALH